MRRLLKTSGMSFLEIMVSLAIFSVIIGAIFASIFTGRLYWRVGSVQLDIQDQARLAVSKMSKELCQSRPGTGKVAGGPAVAIIEGLPADDSPYSSVTFRIPEDTDGDGTVLDLNNQIEEWSDKITYSLVNGQIIRSTDTGSSTVLANNVSSLEFTRAQGAPKLIEVKVVTAKQIPGTGETVSHTLRSWVRLRN